MKINFLSLNENLRHQRLAVKEMTHLKWIKPDHANQLRQALDILEDFNVSMISENNGIEIVDASIADIKTWSQCEQGLHDWNHERWTDHRTQIYKCSICGKRREEV